MKTLLVVSLLALASAMSAAPLPYPVIVASAPAQPAVALPPAFTPARPLTLTPTLRTHPAPAVMKIEPCRPAGTAPVARR